MTSQIPEPGDVNQTGGSENVGQTGNQQPPADQSYVPPTGAPADPQTGQPYGQPQAGQQYAQPGQQQYAQQGQYIPPAGAGAPVGNNLQLNYWLSVFFMFIPALIFFLTDKGKSQQLDLYNRENLNFSLVRTGVWLITVIFVSIPLIGWLIWIVGLIAQLVLFVFHIMAAAKVKDNFDSGQAPGFIFNIPIIK